MQYVDTEDYARGVSREYFVCRIYRVYEASMECVCKMCRMYPDNVDYACRVCTVYIESVDVCTKCDYFLNMFCTVLFSEKQITLLFT